MFSYPTPFTPPTTEDDKLSWLRLIRSRRVGVQTFWRLITEHGSARAALIALPGLADAAGVKGYAICSESSALAEFKAARQMGARLLIKGDTHYPAALAAIPDAPPLLWVLGDMNAFLKPMVAIVGARNASSLGTRMARRLAHDLAEAGMTVVSGLARGIDTVAHAASIDNGTIAVMAGGLDIIYPPENADLARDIIRNGARLSEQPFGMEPQTRHFPLRNRIIAGLSKAVVVVEAAHRSGSLITARIALDQGREVLAVPGHPLDARAGGCNMLLRDGATLVRDAVDVLSALSQLPDVHQPLLSAPTEPKDVAPATTKTPPQVSVPEGTDLSRRILCRLGASPIAEDQLLRDLAVSAREIAPALLSLELQGSILRAPGGLWSLAV